MKELELFLICCGFAVEINNRGGIKELGYKNLTISLHRNSAFLYNSKNFILHTIDINFNGANDIKTKVLELMGELADGNSERV